MSDPAFTQMLRLCGAAAGLVLLGGARLLVGGRPVAVRVAAMAVCAAFPVALTAALGLGTAGVVAGAAVAVAAAGSMVLGNGAVTARLGALARGLTRPGGQAAALAVAGAALLVGSVARYEIGFEAQLDAEMEYMAAVTWKPPMGPATDVAATTDAGRPVTLLRPDVIRPPAEARVAESRTLTDLGFAERLIRLRPATDECNCHGWVFTGGRYWIGPEDVDNILTDNGYRPVSDPRPGDVAVYRDDRSITHTGLVRTGGPGRPVLVESKWGWMGVFLHRPEDTCYGQRFTFYRGPRETHVIAGLGAPTPPGDGGTHLSLAEGTGAGAAVGH